MLAGEPANNTNLHVKPFCYISEFFEQSGSIFPLFKRSRHFTILTGTNKPRQCPNWSPGMPGSAPSNLLSHGGFLGLVAQCRLRSSESSILALMIIFRVKINVAIFIEYRNGVKIIKNWVLGISIFTQKLTRPP